MNHGYIAEQLSRLSDAVRSRTHVQVVYTDELNEFLVDLLDRYKRDLLMLYAQQTKKNPGKWVDMNIHLLPAREYISTASVSVPSEDETMSEESEPSPDDTAGVLTDSDITVTPINKPVVTPAETKAPSVKPEASPVVSPAASPYVSPYASPVVSPYVSPVVSPYVSPTVSPYASPQHEDGSVTVIPDADDDDPVDESENFLDDLEIDELAEYPHLADIRSIYEGTLIMYSANRAGADGMMIESIDNPFPQALVDLLNFMKSDPEYHTIFGLPCTEGSVCEIVNDKKCFFVINKRYRHTEDYVCTRLKGIFGCTRVK